MEIREFLFQPLLNSTFSAQILSSEPGILAGSDEAIGICNDLGVRIKFSSPDGSSLIPNSPVFEFLGSPEALARVEEEVLGRISKASGVATSAGKFVDLSAARARIVCGGWKKTAPEIRRSLRAAISVGGAGIRLTDEPFVYLDKNIVRMFGSIKAVVLRARQLPDRVVVVQIRGETGAIESEALEAYNAGAKIIMVDTGDVRSLELVQSSICRAGFRDEIKLAFGGSVDLNNLEEIINAGADIVDVGRRIIDAPLIDFRLDVRC